MMGNNNKKRESRGFIPDSLTDTGIYFESFANDLMKQMGFTDSGKPPKPAHSERQYSYEDTGIIDESIDRTLAMFSGSYENIALPQTMGIQPTEAPSRYRSESSTYADSYANSYEDSYEDIALPQIAETQQTMTTSQFQPEPSAYDTYIDPSEDEDTVPQQSSPSSRWESMPTQMDFDEEPEKPPKKKRFKFFSSTRRAHIRFIIIIFAIIMIYMLILGFLASRGIVNIGF